jgi:hypothetical protein
VTAALVGLLAGGIEAQETTAADIVRNPNAYSNRMVTVRGIMMNLRPDTTFGPTRAAGVVFDLAAGPAFLVVRSIVPPPCPVGSPVTIDGRFLPLATIHQQLYPNVIEATFVRCR